MAVRNEIGKLTWWRRQEIRSLRPGRAAHSLVLTSVTALTRGNVLHQHSRRHAFHINVMISDKTRANAQPACCNWTDNCFDNGSFGILRVHQVRVLN